MMKTIIPVDSDEEELSNTIGNVPLRWYDEYDHVGYNKFGDKIAKPSNSIRQANEIDWFLDKMENGGQWRSVYNSLTGERIHLTDEDVKLARRIHKCDNLENDNADNPYAPWPDLYSSKVELTPAVGAPPSKASFIPNLDEKRIVSKYLHAIRMGWLKTERDPLVKCKKENISTHYDLWASNDDNKVLRSCFLSAPKLTLPGHEESYNPLPEYRTNVEYPSCLRHVAAYEGFMQERFERLLDLYLCPRIINMRARFDPAILLPALPSPKDLWPYPCNQTRSYTYNHKLLGKLNSFEFDLSGAYFACSGEKSYSLWHTATERMLACQMENAELLSWSNVMPLLAVAVGGLIKLCAVGHLRDIQLTEKLLDSAEVVEETCCKWAKLDKCVEMLSPLYSINIENYGKCTQLCWHKKGDYLASVHANNNIIVHQISKRRSHAPFNQRNKKHANIYISFHPTRSLFFIGNQNSIRCYDLSLGKLTRTLKVGGGILLASPIVLHPSGDHLVIGCMDGSVRWFDLELSNRPYKSLCTLHKTTVRTVQIHPKLPLLATASTDSRIVITHARVYDDLLKEPLIMPVKVLQLPRQHNSSKIPNVIIHFHPQNAWILAASAGEDEESNFTQIRLFTDVTR